MSSIRKVLTVAILAIIAPVMTGCGTSATFPFDYETVWNASVSEAIVWHPEVIDEEQRPYRIFAVRNDLMTGTELKYELEVCNDLNPFARRPSTRVFCNHAPNQTRTGQIEADGKRVPGKGGLSAFAFALAAESFTTKSAHSPKGRVRSLPWGNVWWKMSALILLLFFLLDAWVRRNAAAASGDV